MRVGLRGEKFGDLKVEGEPFDQSGAVWWRCVCWCRKARGVSERRLLAGEVTCCVGCEARRKMEAAAARDEAQG